jgi:hypothetical protein
MLTDLGTPDKAMIIQPGGYLFHYEFSMQRKEVLIFFGFEYCNFLCVSIERRAPYEKQEKFITWSDSLVFGCFGNASSSDWR